jgi:hypothetical protein
MTLADRVLRHAQAYENQPMFLEQEKKLPAQSRRATANLLREAAKELSGGVGR